jgi:adenine-specific DNA-methyltransferase
MAKDKVSKPARARIDETVELLEALGMPRAQLNDRSGLVLLALANLHPAKSWIEAEAPLIGITPIMDFAREYYRIDYAPNTRETVRRQTMHQFRDAAVSSPIRTSRPGRPTAQSSATS